MGKHDVELKEKSKGKIIKKLLLVVFILGLIVLASKSDYFNIKYVEAKGNKLVSFEEIKALTQLQGKNILYLNKGSLKKKLCVNPYINDVVIKRILPSKVVIEIKEKEVKGIIKYNNAFINVDEEGRMIQIINKFPDGSIPVINGVVVQQYVPNEYLYKADEAKKKALKAALSVTNYKECKNVINSINVADPYNITLGTIYGIDIKIADCTDIEYMLSYAFSILDNPDLKGKKGYVKINKDGTAIFKKY